jgi:hypothetical protein
MDYAIQLCVKQASGPPKVLDSENEEGRPRDQVISIAKARLITWPVDGQIITRDGNIDLVAGGDEAVFVRVVEIENGSPTGRVVLEETLAELDRNERAQGGNGYSRGDDAGPE